MLGGTGCAVLWGGAALGCVAFCSAQQAQGTACSTCQPPATVSPKGLHPHHQISRFACFVPTHCCPSHLAYDTGSSAARKLRPHQAGP